mgnify:FL=1
MFESRIGDVSGRGKLGADMREIWTMQPRFEKRTPASALSLVSQPRFRAGFDFLRLRANVGEVDSELATWWETFSLADEDVRNDILEAMRSQKGVPRKRVVKASAAPGVDDVTDEAEPLPSSDGDAQDAPRKRRRRRRKPNDGGVSGADNGRADSDAAE